MTSSMPQRVTALEGTFRTIERERMANAPILHPALRVEAVGFREWQGRPLGVLITPWFMSLVILPADAAEWAALPLDSIQRFSFPAGDYDFLLAHEESFGDYRACSLFSPMSVFTDQATAVATAAAVMEGLFRATTRDPATGLAQQVKQQTERSLSRRALLRGAFLRREGKA